MNLKQGKKDHTASRRELVCLEQHGVCGSYAQLDRHAFLIDGGRTFTAVHDLTGWESNCVQIFRSPKLPAHNPRLSHVIGGQVNIIGSNHDGDGGSLGAA